jgi:amino acid adenylation domain-containing protein
MTTSTNSLSDAKRALLEQRLKGKRGSTHTTPSLPAIPRRPLAEQAPLSFAQQRMWFLYQLEPHSAAYNMPHGIYLRGALDVHALHHALNEIVRRHATLRTTYAEAEDGTPIQHIHAPRPIDLNRVTLTPSSTLPTGDGVHLAAIMDIPLSTIEGDVTSLRAFARDEAARPFELRTEFPIHATLVALAPEEHLLLLTLHHIAADGWSWGIFFNDLKAGYAGDSLGELPLDYADFAHWQRQTLESEGAIDKQVAYWRKELAEIPPLLELPTDHPRPAVQQTAGGIVRVGLPATLTAELNAFSRSHNSTLFMSLLALFQLLLHRYSGATDVVVGSPIAGRTRPELEPLMGVFINTLALRSRFHAGITFRELLTQTRDTTLNAYAHQELPFERLVEALNPERTLSYSPIFQSQFVFHNNPESNFLLDGLEVGWLPPDREVTKFDLSLSLYEDNGEIKGGLVYNSALYEPATIERMVGHWRVLVGAAIHQPDAPIATLPLLTEPEEYELLVAWNQSHLTIPALPLHECIHAQVQRSPTATALVCEGESLTYAEWERHANQVAHALIAHGVKPESRVALFADRSLAWMVGMYGTLKAGGAYTPIDPITPAERLAGMVAEAGATVLLTQKHLLAELPALPCPVLVLDDSPDAFVAYPDHTPKVTVSPENSAYILFTSGSTGRPKGVAVEHRQIVNYLHGILARADFPAGASFAIVSTLAADLGNTTLFPSLVTGGTLHIIPYERATDPLAAADYFRTHRIDCLKIVPSHFEAWLTAPNPVDVVPHQRLIFGGEASSWELMARIRTLRPTVTILNHYGPTETTVGVLTCAVPEIPIAGAAIVPLGRPLANSHLYVLDRAGQPVPVGVPGELFIGGAQVTRGYLGRPDLTAERFVPDPFSDVPGARLYRTGDRVRYLPDGNLEFLGRVDFQVKVRGYRIELGEIEAVLKQHPAIREAVVTVREETVGDKRLVAYIVERKEKEERRNDNGTESSLSIADLRTYIREHLPDYMVPTAFVQLEQLPLNANGKIDRRALPAPDLQRDATLPFTAPTTPQELQVAAVWCEILGLEQVGIDDNFFDVGGESFKAIRVVRKLDPAMSVMTLFKYPTIRELAQVLGGETPVAEQGLLHELTKPLPAAQTTLTLVCIPYGGASAISYRPLAEALPTGTKLLAVELPGHDFSRRDEPLAPLNEVAERIVAEIQSTVTGPVALYGHCVGTALTTEIARRLEAVGIIPESVFLAGAFPQPRLPGKLFQWWTQVASRDRLLSDRVYHDFLRSLGGFNDTLDPAELAFTMRNLRHDFNESEAYYTAAYEDGTPTAPKLQAPVVCIVGEKDRATEYYPERYAEWRDFAHTVRLAIVRHAGHFFLKHQPTAIADIIARQVAAIRLPDPAPVQPESATQEKESNRLTSGGGNRPPTPPALPPRLPGKPSSPSLTTFFLVAFGQLISMIGSGLTSFALGIWVFQQTAAVADLSLIALLSLLPGILTLPIAGALVDRVDRRKLMLAADVVAALRTLTVIGLLATGNLGLWHIYIAVTVGSIVGAFQRPAYVAAMAQLVPKKYLGHANGIVQFATAAGQSLAPLLAAALVATIQLEGVLFLDVLSYVVAITILLMIRFPATLWRKREEPLHREIYNGWQYIVTRRPLVAMVVFFCISNLLLAGMTVLLTPYGLALGNEATLGMIMSAGSLGLMAGGILMSAWGGTPRRAEGMIGFVALEGLFMVLMGSIAHPWVAMVGLFGFQLAISLSNGHWQALIQTKVPFDLHGRVFSINQMLAWSTMPIGYLLAGWLADNVFTTTVAAQMGSTAQGLGIFIVIIGVLTAIVGVLGMTYRTLRYMEEALPDPYADSMITQAGDPKALVLFDPKGEVAVT